MPPSRGQLRGATLYLLLELTIAGRVYRFSTSGVTVSSSRAGDPAELHFVGGLDPIDIEDALALAGDFVPDRNVAVSVLFSDDQHEGWAAIAAADGDLGDASAVLYLWREGDDIEDAIVVARGLAEEPVYDAPGTPVSFSIGQDPWEDRSPLLAAGAQVTQSAWEGWSPLIYKVDENILGAWYPRVYGCPGYIYPGDDMADLPAVPALHVLVDINKLNNYEPGHNDSRVLLMGHAGTGGTVTLYNIDAPHSDADDGLGIVTPPGTAMAGEGMKAVGLSPALNQDQLGRQVAWLIVDGDESAGDLQIAEGATLFYGFDQLTAGGLPHPVTGVVMRGAGDILIDLLQHTSIPLDLDRLNAAAGYLNRFLLDFFVNDDKTAWNVIQDDLLPILPISLVQGTNGLYPVVYRWDAVAEDAVARIDTGTDAVRIAPVTTSHRREVANEIRLNFGLDMSRNEHRRHLTFGHKDDGSGRYEVHPLAVASFGRYKHKPADPLSSDVIYDPGTAAQVLQWKIAHRCATKRETAFLLPQEYASLEPGSVVLVTDEAISWEDEVCLVMGVSRQPGDVAIRVRTVPNFIRDRRG